METIANPLDLGGWGVALSLVVFIVVALVRGWLVAGTTANLFLEGWKVERESRQRLEDREDETLELSRTAVAILKALDAERIEAERVRNEGST